MRMQCISGHIFPIIKPLFGRGSSTWIFPLCPVSESAVERAACCLNANSQYIHLMTKPSESCEAKPKNTLVISHFAYRPVILILTFRGAKGSSRKGRNHDERVGFIMAYWVVGCQSERGRGPSGGGNGRLARWVGEHRRCSDPLAPALQQSRPRPRPLCIPVSNFV